MESCFYFVLIRRQIGQQGLMPFQRKALWFTCVGDIAGSGSYTLDWLAEEKAKKGAVLQDFLSIPCSTNRQTKELKETRVSRAPPIKLLMKVLSSCNTVSILIISALSTQRLWKALISKPWYSVTHTVSLFSCLVKDTKCWEHGESDWVPDRGKQPLYFPGSFLGTGVRYLSRQSCRLPTLTRDWAEVFPGSAVLHWAEGTGHCCAQSVHSPGSWGALLRDPAAFKSRLPRGVGEDTKKEAVSGYGFSGSEAQLERAQGCDLPGTTGCLAAEFTTDPSTRQQGSVSPGPRHLFRRCWACSIIPQSLPRFLRSCRNLLVALTTVTAL